MKYHVFSFVARGFNRLLFALLFVTSCLLLLACHHTIDSTGSGGPQSTHQQMRTVEHALGATQVPFNPQRLVTPSPCTMEAALALGVQPIGGSHWNWNFPYLQRQIEGIRDVGWIPDINLESIAALNPDLILGTVDQQRIYNLLSKIAPTFLAKEYPQGSGDWKEVFLQSADALNRSGTAEQVMADYYERLVAFQAETGDRLNSTEVSVVAVFQEHINLYLEDDFSGTILKDAGLSRPASQQINRKTSPAGSTNVSKERLQDLDADVLFLVVNGSEPQTQNTVRRLKADPLWSQLEAVQNNQVFEVPDYWLGCSPLAANAVIDDLFKYFANDR
jgi:iron complex transport system substrate-binding protein